VDSIAKLKDIYPQMTKSKPVLIGGLLFAIILSYLLIVNPIYKGYTNAKEGIKTKTESYKSSLGIISEKNSLMEKLNAAENKFKETENRLLQGARPPIAAAELQQIIKGMSSIRNIDIRAEKVLQPEIFEGYIGIPVEIEFQSSMNSLKEFLFDLEHSSVIMFVPEMKVRVTNTMDPTDVQVNMVIEGIIKKGASVEG